MTTRQGTTQTAEVQETEVAETAVKQKKVIGKKKKGLTGVPGTLMPGKISLLNEKELTAYLKAAELDTAGTHHERAERLRYAMIGPQSRFVQGLSRCKVCGSMIQVTHTEKKMLPDGRTLISRNVKCVGKNRHTYVFKEIPSK